VRGLMARGGKKKNHVPDETQSEEVRRNVGHEIYFPRPLLGVAGLRNLSGSPLLSRSVVGEAAAY
jgi:hypothetical protein